MKRRRDLARDWVRKAESDLLALQFALDAGLALDAACFHAQQAAERLLKAYLIERDVDFPFTHNLSRLIALCRQQDATFDSLTPLATILTPYAVELRYDSEFWPEPDVAREARGAVLAIKGFVLQRLSVDLQDNSAGPA